MKSLFLVFEGGEGSGKSTQSKILYEKLKSEGFKVIHTREPGGTPFAEEIRNLVLGNHVSRDPMTDLLMIIAARNDHVKQKILPALQDGYIVICDRFTLSTIAYQVVALEIIKEEKLLELQNMIFGKVPNQYYFILDIEAEEGIKRANIRRNNADADIFEKKDMSFHHKVNSAYRNFGKNNPDSSLVIDATMNMDEISQIIYHRVIALSS